MRPIAVAGCGRGEPCASEHNVGLLRFDPEIPDLPQRSNIPPTAFQPVVRHIREGGVRELLLMRWVMVPFFAKSLDAFKGFSTFNAKSADIGSKPIWKGPMERGRLCVLSADGFYERKVLDTEAKTPKKTALRIHLPPATSTRGVANVGP